MLTAAAIYSLLSQEEILLTGFQRQRDNFHKVPTVLEEERYKCKKSDQCP